MQKQNVHVGTTYMVKVSGRLARVKITRQSPNGGWYGTNTATGREIRIRTAARLRSEFPTPGTGRLDQIRNIRTERISYDEAKKIVDKLEF